MEFSRTEYQSGWPFPSPGDLPNPEQADSLPAETEGMYLSHEKCIQILVKWRIPEWVAFAFSGGSSLTRGSNPGLLHGRQILYQLSYQGSLIWTELKREYAKLPDQHSSKSCSSLHLHESSPPDLTKTLYLSS